MQSSTMEALSRSDTAVLDEHARVFEELAHIVLGHFRVGRNGILRTEARLKSHESIWRHVDRGEVLTDLVDLSAFRIITVYLDFVDVVVDELVRMFPEAQVKPQDKPNGYQTTKLEVRLAKDRAHELGLEIKCDDLLFEVQVRSAMQHLWAALDREYVYDQRDKDDVLVALFKVLAEQAKAFDAALVRVRNAAEQQVTVGRNAASGATIYVPISPETVMGAIQQGGAAVIYDKSMARQRRDHRGVQDTTANRTAQTSAMLRSLGYTNLQDVLARLHADHDFPRWLGIYNERPIAQGGRRPVRRGDTLALFAEYEAAKRGREALRNAFNSAGIQSEAMVDRLYSEVQDEFAKKRNQSHGG